MTNKKTVMEIYKEILLRAEELKNSRLSGDGYLELCWVAGMLEDTHKRNTNCGYDSGQVQKKIREMAEKKLKQLII